MKAGYLQASRVCPMLTPSAKWLIKVLLPLPVIPITAMTMSPGLRRASARAFSSHNMRQEMVVPNIQCCGCPVGNGCGVLDRVLWDISFELVPLFGRAWYVPLTDHLVQRIVISTDADSLQGCKILPESSRRIDRDHKLRISSDSITARLRSLSSNLKSPP